MVIARCCVEGCSTSAQNLSIHLSLFRFPKDDERRRIWAINCGREEVANYSTYHTYNYFRVCSLHFEKEMFSGMSRNRLKKTAVPTIFNTGTLPDQLESSSFYYEDLDTNMISALQNIENDNNCPKPVNSSEESCNINSESCNEIIIYDEVVEESQSVEEYKCRTCLKIMDKDSSTSITKFCYLSNTVKEVIILLVPKLISRLNDNEVVCNDCLEILQSSIKFITKSLEADAILSGCETNVNSEGDVVDQIDIEHDYYSKTNSPGDIQQNCGLETVPVTESNEQLMYGLPPSTDEITEESCMEVMEGDIYEIAYCECLSKKENVTSRKRKKYKTKENVTPRKRKKYYKKKEKVEEETFSCSTCLETFTVKEDYKYHLQVHPRYMCDTCGKTFPKYETLWAHKVTHNAPNSYICEVCGKGYKDVGGLRNHLKSHYSNESFICDICKKVFKKKVVLKAHIKRIHTKRDSIQCPQCGILVMCEGSLRSHIKVIHGKEKPYECKICGKKFGRADYVRNHTLRRHTEKKPKPGADPEKVRVKWGYNIQDNGKPVPCKFCGQWCKNMVKLQMHLETHLKRYQCQFCPLSFSRKAFCKRHEKAHEGGKAKFFRCDTCWKRFKTVEALDQHVLCHNNPRYSCEDCGKTFNRRFLFNHHKLMDHGDIPDKDQAHEIIYNSLVEVSKVDEVQPVE